MSTTNDVPATSPVESLARLGPGKKLAIWALFLVIVYLARDFFFTAFMTFLFCYLTLTVVGWAMNRLSPHQGRPRLRRLLTVGVFVLTPLLLLAAGALLGPRLLEQGHRLGGWLSQTTPEAEVSHLLEGFVGPYEFRQQFGDPQDDRYQQALEEFRAKGQSHVAAYNQFPKLEAWVEGGFSRQFAEQERNRIRARLTSEGTSSKQFEHWFLHDKVPELQAQAREQVPDKGRPSDQVPPLVRAAASVEPEQLLRQVRRDPAVLSALRKEWFEDELEKGVRSARASPAYQEQFRGYYDKQRESSAIPIPYTFDQYAELQEIRPRGGKAFGEAVEKMRPSAPDEGEARLRADFEAAKKHELFQQWWSTSSPAQLIQHQLRTRVSGNGAERFERVFASLINVPLDVGTALLLSIFICIDFPNLSRGFRRLRDTWLRDVYDEMAPVLTSLAHLIGRSMHAQGLIALCNATLIFLALRVLGVEHDFLLSLAVFVLCLVPTLGAALSLVFVSLVALVQPGGGPILALKAAAAVVLVMLVESFVLSPRILGRMMELHPVLSIAILPVAQYFFGIWGLILAIPVAVYVVHVLILRRGLPGKIGRLAAAGAPSEPDASEAPLRPGGVAEPEEMALPRA
jgi:predicted PurR-regulated permease PerM